MADGLQSKDDGQSGRSKKVGEMADSQSKDDGQSGQSKKVGEMGESEDDGQSGQPQPKKKCIEADFVYFGLKLYYFRTYLDTQPYKRIPFNSMKNEVAGCDNILKAIKSDMKKLRDSMIGKSDDWCPNGCFMENRKGVYVYQHNQHAACSHVLLSQLETSCRIDVSRNLMLKCTQHLHHDNLQPFFMDNAYLHDYYKVAAEQGRMEINPQLDLLEKALKGEASLQGTMFECPSSLSCNWNENDWTKRLARGIAISYPNLEVSYTTNLGLDFAELKRKLRVELNTSCFMFRGAPDILIHRNAALLTPSSSDINTHDLNESSEDETIENSFQRPPLVGADECSLPQKVGELVAGLHILLVSKIWRSIVNGKDTQRVFSVRGLMLDKVCATVQCSLSAQVEYNKAVELKIKLRDHTGVILSAEVLCSSIAALCNPVS